MEKSLTGPGLKPVELKRNLSNNTDNNDESSLFISARSEIDRDFLKFRVVKKPIIEFEIDSRKEHFCVNIILKLNKKGCKG